MERPTIRKAFNGGNPSEQPMMNVMETITSLHCRSFSQKNNLKGASFSSSCSYLRPEATRAGSGEDIIIGCSVVDDSDQISVFDAESYFNESNIEQKENNKRVVTTNSGVNNNNTERCGFSTVSSVDDGYGYGRRNYRLSAHDYSFHHATPTPTASSEASWNSQIGLLSNPPGSMAVSLRNLPVPADHNQKKGGGGGGGGSSSSTATAKWFFGRKSCPCSGKKSVQVKEEKQLSEPPRRTPSPSTSSYPKRQSPRSVDQSTVAEKQFVESSHRNSLTDQDDGGIERTSEKVIPIFRRFENHFASNINIPHHHHHHQVLGSFKDGTGGFSFPILNQSSSSSSSKPLELKVKGIPTSSPREDPPPGDSLDVFQPPDESVSTKSMEVLQVQRALLVSHAGVDRDHRRGFAFPASPMSRITAATDDDVASDASSDLFEIESFSTQPSSYPMFRRRDSLDDATTFNATRIAAGGAGGANGGLYCRPSLDEPLTPPSVAAMECYEPSEASIDWSVTTAEGFDRTSVTNLSINASDIDDFAIMRRYHHEKAGGIRVGGGDVSKWRSGNGGLLLSCRCEKAVSVGPHPVKCTQIQQEEGPRAVGLGGGPRLPSHLPLTSTMRHVSGDSGSSRPRHNVVVNNNNKPPLATSHSARLSLAFAT